MKKFSFSIFALVFGNLIWATQAFGQITTSPTPEKTIFLREALGEIGNKYDCYFTIEIVIEAVTFKHSLEEQGLVFRLREKSLRQEIEELTKAVPNLTYKVDIHNSKIIHIIDARLTQENDYAMEKIIKRLNFEGILFDLVNAIGQQGADISSRGSMDTREFHVLDYSTKVLVKETKKSVRNILTNSIPLKGHGRVLWIAQTQLGGGHTTYVRYLR